MYLLKFHGDGDEGETIRKKICLKSLLRGTWAMMAKRLRNVSVEYSASFSALLFVLFREHLLRLLTYILGSLYLPRRTVRIAALITMSGTEQLLLACQCHRCGS